MRSDRNPTLPPPEQTLVLAAGTILVKFTVAKSYELHPAIPEVNRLSADVLEMQREVDAIRLDQNDLARQGRVRKFRVDTGKQTLALERTLVSAPFVRIGLANNGYALREISFFQKPEDKKRVVQLAYRWVGDQISQTVVKPGSVEEALRELAKTPFQACFGWHNPPKPDGSTLDTLNFTGHQPQAQAKQHIAVRDGWFVPVDAVR